MGTNGCVSSSSVVTNRLTDLRSAADGGAKIFVIVPFNGTCRANVTTGYADYKASSNDQNIFLADLGSDGVTYSISTGYSYDALHPNMSGHSQLASLLSDIILPNTITDNTPNAFNL